MTQPNEQDVPAADDGSGAANPSAPPATSAEKDPSDWVTGDEPATGPQLSYLSTLAREAGEEVPDSPTKAQASELIDRYQGASRRLTDEGDSPAAGAEDARS